MSLQRRQIWTLTMTQPMKRPNLQLRKPKVTLTKARNQILPTLKPTKLRVKPKLRPRPCRQVLLRHLLRSQSTQIQILTPNLPHLPRLHPTHLRSTTADRLHPLSLPQSSINPTTNRSRPTSTSARGHASKAYRQALHQTSKWMTSGVARMAKSELNGDVGQRDTVTDKESQTRQHQVGDCHSPRPHQQRPQPAARIGGRPSPPQSGGGSQAALVRESINQNPRFYLLCKVTDIMILFIYYVTT